MGATPENTIVGLDVGTTKIAAVAAEQRSDGGLTYVDGTYVDAAGVRNGIIVDIQEASASIEGALYDLEDRCGRRLTTVCVGVGGPHVSGRNARGAGQIQPLGREITHDDVSRAIAEARAAVALPENRDILHEIPRAYLIDGQPGIRDPHGMLGAKLEVDVHYATGVSTTIANLLKCVRLARVAPAMLVSAPLAAGEAVRSAYEGASCLAVADVGAETTGLAIYEDGAVWSSDVLAGGGADITKDIAAQLKIPLAAAEDVKRRYGQCNLRDVEDYELVDLPPSAGIDALLPRSELALIIQERVYHLADALCPRLELARKAGLEPELLVLTGGAADLPGLTELLTLALEVPVRRAAPASARNMPAWLERPELTTAAGLVLWYARYTRYGDVLSSGKLAAIPRLTGGVKRALRRLLP
jgi:cell division protein FtsA